MLHKFKKFISENKPLVIAQACLFGVLIVAFSLIAAYTHYDDIAKGNIFKGHVVAQELTGYAKLYLNAGGDPEDFKLSSFPEAYDSLSKGLKVMDINFQYALPDGKALDTSVFEVRPYGNFAYIGQGASPFLGKPGGHESAIPALMNPFIKPFLTTGMLVLCTLSSFISLILFGVVNHYRGLSSAGNYLFWALVFFLFALYIFFVHYDMPTG